MDEMLIEIMEVLKEAKELIDKRNAALTYKGNQIINVMIDGINDGSPAEILLSKDLPRINARITQTEPSTSPIDDSFYVSREMTIDGITFSTIENVKEVFDDAKLAV